MLIFRKIYQNLSPNFLKNRNYLIFNTNFVQFCDDQKKLQNMDLFSNQTLFENKQYKAGSCASELWIKVNCRLKVNCKENVWLAC